MNSNSTSVIGIDNTRNEQAGRRAAERSTNGGPQVGLEILMSRAIDLSSECGVPRSFSSELQRTVVGIGTSALTIQWTGSLYC